MAHVRRKFFDIVKSTKTAGKAHVAMGYIKKLYAIETIAQEQNLDSEEKKLL